MKLKSVFLYIILTTLSSCVFSGENNDNVLETYEADTVSNIAIADTSQAGFNDTLINQTPIPVDSGYQIWTTPLPLLQIVNFAKTLIGTPYQYASTDPAVGFDCSGFITYVFNHFGIQVPRSSIDFTNRGIEVPLQQAKQGDLILFTGTDSASTTVGHMGIVVDNSDSLRFIHSSSGKANGVTITPLNAYYMRRFVKVIAIDKGI